MAAEGPAVAMPWM